MQTFIEQYAAKRYAARFDAEERNIFQDVANFANKFGDSLVNALVGVVAGAVTAAVTGNIIEGVKIAATGVGKLIVDVMRTPAEKRSLTGRSRSFFQRLFTSFMLIDALVALVIVICIVGITVWGLRTKQNDTGYEEQDEETDEDFQDRAPRRNKALIVAINRWKNGSTLAGCDRDGANMLRRVGEIWNIPQIIIDRALQQYWLAESDVKGCSLRIVYADTEIRVVRNAKATKANIEKGLRWLRDGVQEEDERLQYHSGHGTNTPSNTESDKLNECIMAYDHDWNKPETWFEDDIFYKYTQDLPNNSSFTLILDTCHSAGFLRSAGAEARYIAPPLSLSHGRTAKPPMLRSDEYTNDNVMLLSGCTSDSVSYSNRYEENGKTVMEGALTRTFLQEQRKRPLASVRDIHRTVYATLATSQYKQEPQLQGSERLKDKPFLVGA